MTSAFVVFASFFDVAKWSRVKSARIGPLIILLNMLLDNVNADYKLVVLHNEPKIAVVYACPKIPVDNHEYPS